MLSATQPRRVHIFSGAKKAASAVVSPVAVPPTSSVVSAPAPGQAGAMTISGPTALQPGDIVAVGSGQKTPDGYLGKVSAVSGHANTTVLQVSPEPLIDAVPSGSIDTASAGRRVMRAVGRNLSDQIAKGISCGGNGPTLSLSGNASVSVTPSLSAHWSWFHLASAQFTGTVSASVQLEASLSASASCDLEKTPLLAHPWTLGVIDIQVGPVPVVIVPEVQLYVQAGVDAKAAVTTDVHGSVSATAGVAYNHGSISPVGSHTFNFGYDPPTLSASGDAHADLIPTLDLLLYGVGGPEASFSAGLDLSADSTKDPWWTLTAPVSLDATLAIPDLGLRTPSVNIYRNSFALAQAATGTAPKPAPPPPPSPVPSNGPTLAYTGDTAGSSANGDLTFDNFSSATGENVDIQDTLPASLSGYRCVVLDINQSFSDDDTNALAGYLKAGGTILALGEHAGGFDDADAALNHLATSLGATGLSLNDDQYDNGANATTAIESSPLTAGVGTLGDDFVSSLTVQSPAQTLVETADDSSVALVGVQSVNGGTFVLSGDSNMFTDNNDASYDNQDNGIFAKNLCP